MSSHARTSLPEHIALAPGEPPIVDVQGLWTQFGKGDETFTVHQDLNFTVQRGEMLSLVGGSGFMGDQVGVMHGGRLEQVGTPEAIFHQPRTRFVAEFLGQTDFLPGEVTEQEVQTPLGLLPQRLPLASGTAVDIAVRPDDLRLTPDKEGNGRIVSRQFVGIAFVYEVRLNDGTVIHSWQPHENSFGEGTAVTVQFAPPHNLPCLYHNHAVSPKSR